MKVVVITAGHSNTDSGAVTTDSNGKLVKESDLAVKFRNAVTTYLKANHIVVLNDGVGTDNKDLKYAISLIKGSTLAIEFHMNASTNNKAVGVETISLPKDKSLSQELSQAIATVFNTKVRGEQGWIDQSSSARGKLGYVNNGGLIVELGFISNATELGTFNSSYWLAAKKVSEIIIEHLKQEEKK